MDVFSNVVEGTRQYFLGLPAQSAGSRDAAAAGAAARAAHAAGQPFWPEAAPPSAAVARSGAPATSASRPPSVACVAPPQPLAAPAPAAPAALAPPAHVADADAELEPQPHIIHKATVMREAREKRREEELAGRDADPDALPPPPPSPPSRVLREPPPPPQRPPGHLSRPPSAPAVSQRVAPPSPAGYARSSAPPAPPPRAPSPPHRYPPHNDRVPPLPASFPPAPAAIVVSAGSERYSSTASRKRDYHRIYPDHAPPTAPAQSPRHYPDSYAPHYPPRPPDPPHAPRPPHPPHPSPHYAVSSTQSYGGYYRSVVPSSAAASASAPPAKLAAYEPPPSPAQTSPSRTAASAGKPGFASHQPRPTVSVTAIVHQMNQTKQKRESPLDLSVKTVKNSADSTAHDDADASPERRPLSAARAPLAGPAPTRGSHKVDFSPNFHSQYADKRPGMRYAAVPSRAHAPPSPAPQRALYDSAPYENTVRTHAPRTIGEPYIVDNRYQPGHPRYTAAGPGAPPERRYREPHVELVSVPAPPPPLLAPDDARKRLNGPPHSDVPSKLIRYETWVDDSRIERAAAAARLSRAAHEQRKLMSQPVYSYSTHRRFETFPDDRRRASRPYPLPPPPGASDPLRHVIQRGPSRRESADLGGGGGPADKRVLSILRNSLETRHASESPRAPPPRVTDFIVIDDDPVPDLTAEGGAARGLPLAAPPPSLPPPPPHKLHTPRAVDSIRYESDATHRANNFEEFMAKQKKIELHVSPEAKNRSPDGDFASRIRTKGELKGYTLSPAQPPPPIAYLPPLGVKREDCVALDPSRLEPQSQKAHLFRQLYEENRAERQVRLESVIKNEVISPDNEMLPGEIKLEPINIEEIEKDAVSPIGMEEVLEAPKPQSTDVTLGEEDFDWATTCDSFLEQLKTGCAKKKAKRKKVDAAECGSAPEKPLTEPSEVFIAFENKVSITHETSKKNIDHEYVDSGLKSKEPTTIEPESAGPGDRHNHKDTISEKEHKLVKESAVCDLTDNNIITTEEHKVNTASKETNISSIVLCDNSHGNNNIIKNDQLIKEKGTSVISDVGIKTEPSCSNILKNNNIIIEKRKDICGISSTSGNTNSDRTKDTIKKNAMEDLPTKKGKREPLNIIKSKTKGIKIEQIPKIIDTIKLNDKNTLIFSSQNNKSRKVKNNFDLKDNIRERKPKKDIGSTINHTSEENNKEQELKRKCIANKSITTGNDHKERKGKNRSIERIDMSANSIDTKMRKASIATPVIAEYEALAEVKLEPDPEPQDSRVGGGEPAPTREQLQQIEKSVIVNVIDIIKSERAGALLLDKIKREAPDPPQQPESSDDDEPLIRSKLLKEKHPNLAPTSTVLTTLSVNPKSVFVKLEYCASMSTDLGKELRDAQLKDNSETKTKSKQKTKIKSRVLQSAALLDVKTVEKKVCGDSSSVESESEERSVASRLRVRKIAKSEETGKGKSPNKSLTARVRGAASTAAGEERIASAAVRKPGFGDGSDFHPGWEEEVYKYKRSLRMPSRLIHVPLSPWLPARVSSSLPDLDPSPVSPAPSCAATLPPPERAADSDLDSDSSSAPTRTPPRPPQYDSEASSSTVFSFAPPRRSILDLLIQKYGRKDEAKRRGKDGTELATAAPVGSDVGPLAADREAERRACVKEAIGEERPASAPPSAGRELPTSGSSGPPPDAPSVRPRPTRKLGRDRPRPKSSSIRDGLRSTSLKKCDAKGRLLRLKKRNDLLKSLGSKKLKEAGGARARRAGKREQVGEGGGPSAPAPASQGPAAPPGGKRLKRLFARRKFSSGFDYIRKKKIARARDEERTALRRAVRAAAAARPRPPSASAHDVHKEIKGWFINKSVGETPLHRASRLGYTDCVAYCLERLGAEASARDNAGFTPLHVAAARGHLHIARLLLQYGANVSAAAQGGIRPLHEASENEHVEVVRLLLSYGADPLLATYAGHTPAALADLAGAAAAALLLRRHVADVQGLSTEPWRFPHPLYGEVEESGCDALASPPPESPPPPAADVEFQSTDAPLPPFYSLRPAPGVSRTLSAHSAHDGLWCLLQDVAALLQIKSRDSLLKQIHCGAGSPRELLRELRTSEFLERAQCHALLGAGEKVNVRASKVSLVRLTDKLRQLLRIETTVLS